MSEQQPRHESHLSAGVDTMRNHQFIIMIAGVIILSLFLVYVALSLYVSSGTIQLDLSRPGYDSAREEATKSAEVFKAFPEDGPINVDTLNEFETQYKQKAGEALIEIDAFSGDVLSDEALGISSN